MKVPSALASPLLLLIGLVLACQTLISLGWDRIPRLEYYRSEPFVYRYPVSITPWLVFSDCSFFLFIIHLMLEQGVKKVEGIDEQVPLLWV